MHENYKRVFWKFRRSIINSYTLKNTSGIEISIIDYDCIITKLNVPDKNGNFENIVLGFDTIQEYIDYSPYFGSVIGRVAGRIQGGEFELDGLTNKLDRNDGNNHLHGGQKGLDKVIWNTTLNESEESSSITFTYLSKDGNEGYPGNVNLEIIYSLNNDNEFSIHYNGISDKITILDLTNHTYFNLSGELKRDILDHQLTMNSSKFLELNEELIPTGEFLSVNNTDFDFNLGRKIKSGISSQHKQNILVGNGYDHPFILDNPDIILFDEESGRKVVVNTDRPTVVLYTGNMLTDDYCIRGIHSKKHLGLCLKTQGYPDAIHHSHFPSSILQKDKIFQSTTSYKFII